MRFKLCVAFLADFLVYQEPFLFGEQLPVVYEKFSIRYIYLNSFLAYNSSKNFNGYSIGKSHLCPDLLRVWAPEPQHSLASLPLYGGPGHGCRPIMETFSSSVHRRVRASSIRFYVGAYLSVSAPRDRRVPSALLVIYLETMNMDPRALFKTF